MVEEVVIKVTADTKDAEKNLKDTKKDVEDVGKEAEGTKSRWNRLTDFLRKTSPTFGQMADTWEGSSEKIDESFKGNTKMAGLFKVGVIAALAAVAAKAGQVAWQFAKDTAAMFDPQGYAKAAGEAQRSIKKLKTAIGSFTSPLVQAINTVISKVVDGLTWIVENLRVGIAYITGFLKKVFDPVARAIGAIIDGIKNGINAISNFLGFGDVFKDSAKSAEDTAEQMGEVVEATSAGLAGFDKLNTLDIQKGGDAEEADKINEAIKNAEATGASWFDMLAEKMGNLFDIDWGGLWDGFCMWGGDAIGVVSEYLGGLWAGFLEWGGNAWNTICEVAGTIWSTILGIATTVWNTIVSIATTIWNIICTVATTIWNIIVGVATTVWNTICTIATTIWNIISGVALGVWNAISSVATAIWNGIKTIATTVWNVIYTVATTLWGLIAEPIEALWGTFEELGSKAWSVLEGAGQWFIKNIINPIKSAIEWIWEKVKWVADKIGGIMDSIGGILGGVGDAIGGAVGGVADFLGLAGGGAVAPNNPQPYILGDNTREYEVVSPVSLMKDTVKAAIAEMGGKTGGGNSGPIELQINLDGRKLARAIYDPMQTERMRRGSRA